MKILLAGWGEGAEKAVEAVLKSKHSLSAVAVPVGFDGQGVARLSHERGVTLKRLSESKDLSALIKKFKVDLLVSVSWPKILPPEVFGLPRLGSLNVHASLLPKYRGVHPLNWAMIKDERETGVTVHFLSEGADQGGIILQKSTPISDRDTIVTLKKRVVRIGAKLLVRSLRLIEEGRVLSVIQKEEAATFAPRRYPRDGQVNWKSHTREIFNLVRALTEPYPNAFCFKGKGEKVFLEKVFFPPESGRVVFKHKTYFGVTTGDGVLLVKAKGLKVGDKLF